ncbi:glycosyltransferase family 2 protein [Desulforamulus ruminis]|uniref:Glycosyl transferase family 2 n=1 Tax=Desulforamulus ruminis (strain ATCC 23193 / DSM 2154 / NCIMB 8452 / DL) TaxID=696281 RepID=F6DPT3_DESRL|nr:glycosyltransferase family 2 protein [Desulforamulus ruminis]AEG60772.1 glycosyl transferase family 2 [Desulforamulus ruminis DSM 2154]
MISLSLCMIVKNEQEVLARCLESVEDLFDEIIIVDTGSIDSTAAIAKGFSDKVYDFPWVDDFAKARNYSFSKATMDYIMWLDADDILLPSELEKLKELKRTLSPDTDVVMMKYNVGFDEGGRVTLSYCRERILKRQNNYVWQDPVHEFIPLWGKIIDVDISITHGEKNRTHSDRNLKIYERMLSQGGELSTRGKLYYARELKTHGHMQKGIGQYKAFLAAGDGWVEDCISACFELSFCYEDDENIFNTLCQSFQYASPRAEICTRMGEYFFNRHRFKEAIFWYDLSLKLEKPTGWGFILEDYWGYIPAIQLCLCYYKLSDIKKAIEYNDLAAVFKPDDPSVLQNKQYFQKYNSL